MSAERWKKEEDFQRPGAKTAEQLRKGSDQAHQRLQQAYLERIAESLRQIKQTRGF